MKVKRNKEGPVAVRTRGGGGTAGDNKVLNTRLLVMKGSSHSFHSPALYQIEISTPGNWVLNASLLYPLRNESSLIFSKSCIFTHVKSMVYFSCCTL